MKNNPSSKKLLSCQKGKLPRRGLFDWYWMNVAEREAYNPDLFGKADSDWRKKHFQSLLVRNPRGRLSFRKSFLRFKSFVFPYW